MREEGTVLCRVQWHCIRFFVLRSCDGHGVVDVPTVALTVRLDSFHGLLAIRLCIFLKWLCAPEHPSFFDRRSG
jgi:hypothetical protein